MSAQQQLQIADRQQPFGQASVVLEKLLDMGFVIMAMRLGAMPSITVKPCEATRKLDSRYRGYSFDGRQYFAEYSAMLEGIEIRWHKPRARIKPWGER